ncbi:MAG: hypothetical protein ISS66_02180 [Desulfobacteraceae bacterium]|nr:hypothetical protein [Desulfobacteraceae bacterium]
MEELTEPGATYVTEDIFKLTEGLFRYESLGEKEVNEKEEPVKTYRVIGPSTRRTRFDVSAERGLTPFTVFASRRYSTERWIKPYSGGFGRFPRPPSQQATIAKLPH